MPCLIKTKDIKQKLLNYDERQKISEIIEIRPNDLFNKKVLLVDDVITTGASMKAAINLIQKCQPKILKILVISKRELTEEEKNNLKNKVIL